MPRCIYNVAFSTAIDSNIEGRNRNGRKEGCLTKAEKHY